MSPDETRRAALDYVRRGWSVIPIRPAAKVPLLPWEVFQSRHATEQEIENWFTRWPNANIGIVTGEISKLAVLDIDPKHGGRESLNAIETRYGPLPATIEVATGGGGRHFYFAYPSYPIRSRVALAPGLDLRADAGIIVAPPSIHPSGNRYAWVPRRDPGSIALAPIPNWLTQLAAGPSGTRHHTPSYWRALIKNGVAEGLRNNSLASLSGYLMWHGLDPAVTTELLLCWNRVLCRPPLDDEEVVRTVASIARLHAKESDD